MKNYIENFSLRNHGNVKSKQNCVSEEYTSVQSSILNWGQLFKIKEVILVNDSLKFQMATLQIRCYFIAKDSNIFSTKNNSVFAFEDDIVKKLSAKRQC